MICNDRKEKIEDNMERWKHALDRRRMEVLYRKTDYMCVNERKAGVTIRMQEVEVKEMQKFKYLGSTVKSNGECGRKGKDEEQSEGLVEFQLPVTEEQQQK